MSRKSGKIMDIQETLKDYNISIKDIGNNDIFINSLSKEAAKVPDYRHPSYVKHKLQDILSICILGFLADCNEWEEIADFAQQKEKWLKKYLELPNGIPSSDTIRLVAGNIDAAYFYQAVIQSLEGLVNDVQTAVMGQGQEKEILSMDGKESRGSKRIQGHNGAVKPLQALNLYSSGCGFCIGQEFIKEKTNEIPAGPVLLGKMDLKGKIVTWDALNTQKETVEAVIRGKGDYVAALKGNHPLFYKELVEYFSEETLEGMEQIPGHYKKTIEKEHGGIATREYYQTDETGWYEDKKKWKGLATFGIVKKKLEKPDGKTVEEKRYYISSLPVDVELFSKAARGHWGVENQLHWHLDFTFRDDYNTTAEKTCAKNMQMLKKIALAILHIVQALYSQSLKRIRKTIAMDCEKELENILSALSADVIKAALYKASD